MSYGINYKNTGLMSQNYSVINTVTKKLSGSKLEDLQKMSSGKMQKISDEEVKKARQKQQNEPKTLNVSGREIIDNFFCKTGNNITYDIDGVKFTNEEMKACKEVVKNAISALPTKGSDLDYKDYAAMGIAQNMVSTYANENLTDEQADIVNKSMEEYLNGLVQTEKERQNSQGYFTDDTEGMGSTGNLNKYYNVRSKLSDNAAETLKKQIKNLPEQTRATLFDNLEAATQRGSVVQSASDKNLASTIKALFENMDIKDEKSVNNAMKQYKSLITPAYQASGINNTSHSNSLTDILNNDVGSFVTQIANAKAVIGNVGNSLDYTI